MTTAFHVLKSCNPAALHSLSIHSNTHAIRHQTESPLLCLLVFNHFLLLEATGMSNPNTMRTAENNVKWPAIGD